MLQLMATLSVLSADFQDRMQKRLRNDAGEISGAVFVVVSIGVAVIVIAVIVALLLAGSNTVSDCFNELLDNTSGTTSCPVL